LSGQKFKIFGCSLVNKIPSSLYIKERETGHVTAS
jgi:hypothetical protein